MELFATGFTIAVAAAVAGAWLWRATRTTWLERLVRRRILVHTRDGQTFDGQLVRVDADGIILAPTTLRDGPHDLDGETFLPRNRIAWYQRPSSDEQEGAGDTR